MSPRIAAGHVLDHPMRATLYDLIRGEPGLPFLEIHHRMRRHPVHSKGLGFGSLSHHLRALERFGHITTRKSGRHRRHYQNGGPWNGDTSGLAALQAPGMLRLAREILADPGASQTTLWLRCAQVERCSRQSVGYRLRDLIDLGLVEEGRRSRAKSYRATERLERLVGFLEGTRAPPALPEILALAGAPMAA